MSHVHVFENSGLGKAPFHYVANIGAEAIQKDGIFWCEHCGTGLKNRHFIRSSDNVLSIVGIDCLNKTGDAGLIEEQKLATRQEKAKNRAREAIGRQSAREEAFLSAYGMGSEELSQANAQKIVALQNEVFDAFCDTNTYQAMVKAGGFGLSIIACFERISMPSGNMIRAAKEVVAKHISGARKNSKAYNEAYISAEREISTLMKLLEKSENQISELKNDVMDKWRQLRD